MRRHIAAPGKISTFRFILLLRRFCHSKIRGRPYVLNIEVTERCNAQCGHCICWKIDPSPEISDYSDIASRFRPVIIWLTGGEPLLRPGIGQVIKKIRMVDPFVYLGMSTNGWLLNQKLARELAEMGLDQINISLDFLGSAHDQHRKINNLWAHIDELSLHPKKCETLRCFNNEHNEREYRLPFADRPVGLLDRSRSWI